MSDASPEGPSPEAPEATAPGPADAGAAERRYCHAAFVDVVMVLPSTNPQIVLQEADPPYRELRIPIGGAEGVAISYAARRLATPRPLTHELFAQVLESFDLSLAVVRITAVQRNSFSAELVITGPTGSRVLGCRASDGIALTLRQRLPAPIMVASEVLDQVGSDPTGTN